MKRNLNFFISKMNNATNNGFRYIKIEKDIYIKLLPIIKILYKEGFIQGSLFVTSYKKTYFKIFLKYNEQNLSVLKHIENVSKMGKNVFCSSSTLWQIKVGLGLYILSTQKGILTLEECRLNNVGGEVLCIIY